MGILRRGARILEQWWLFGTTLLLLLLIAFAGLNWLFRNQIRVDEPKLAEESAKLLAAYLLSILSLILNEAVGKRREARVCAAQRALVLRHIADYQGDLASLGGLDTRAFDTASISIEENRSADAKRKEFIQQAARLQTSMAKVYTWVLGDDILSTAQNYDLFQALHRFTQAVLDLQSNPTLVWAQAVQANASRLIEMSAREV